MDRSTHSDDLSRFKGRPAGADGSDSIRAIPFPFLPQCDGAASDRSIRLGPTRSLDTVEQHVGRNHGYVERSLNSPCPLSAQPSYLRETTDYQERWKTHHHSQTEDFQSNGSDATYRLGTPQHNPSYFTAVRSKNHTMEPNRVHHPALSYSARYYPHGKGHKLPHGLTVKELKDMTSARLAAEARQRDAQDTKGHCTGIAHAPTHPVPSTHSSRSRNMTNGLVLERPLPNEVSSSNNLISSHVQRYHATAHSHSPVVKQASIGCIAPSNRRSVQSDPFPEKPKPETIPSSVEWTQRLNIVRLNHPPPPVQPVTSVNDYYVPHDLSRANTYPVPSAPLSQSLSFPGTSLTESSTAFLPIQQTSVPGERTILTSTGERDNLFVPVVTYGDSYLNGSSVASRGSSPTDSKTDDRSSLMTDNGWLDIFGRPSSAATIPTVVPSSESFCPDDDNYTLTFSPEHKSIHRLDDRSMSSFSPRMTVRNVDQTHGANGVFRSLQRDPFVCRPVPSSTSSYPLSPLRMESDVANDSFVKSWTNSFIEENEDPDIQEADEFPLNRLEHDLNALLTITHEPSMLEKNDFLVSRIDPVFSSSAQTQSVIGIPSQSSSHREAPVAVAKSNTETRHKAPGKSMSGRKSNDGHRHRNAKKKDHAFNG